MASGPLEDDGLMDSDRVLSIEFTLLSGETVSVRDELDEPVSETTVRRYADDLIHQIGTDTVRTFAYWWEGEYYVDAVRLKEVAAISVSTVTDEEDESDDEWDA